MAIIKNLTKFIVQYEITNAPSFLYIQDKHFLPNLFATLNRILNKKYEPKLQQLRNNYEESLIESDNANNQNRTTPVNYELTDMFIALDEYLSVIVQFSTDQYQASVSSSLNTNDLDLQNIQLVVDTINGQSYSHTKLSMVKFKLITSDNSKNKKVAFISLNSLASNLPNRLILSQPSLIGVGKQASIKYHKDKFITVANVFMLNIQQNITRLQSAAASVNREKSSSKSLYIVIDFVLSNINIFPAAYDESYKNLKIAPNSNYYCVYLDLLTHSWSTRGAKLIDYNYDTNTVKCSYDHFSIYSVVTSTSGLTGGDSQPIQFSIVSYVMMPMSFVVMFSTCVLLILIKVSL